MMRILFVADGRSPTALQWMEYFVRKGHEVHLASTYVCQPNLRLASLNLVPVGFGGAQRKPGQRSGVGAFLPTGLRTRIRDWLGPATIRGAATQLRTIIKNVQPDLVHAMRIPYEGMVAAAAEPKAPLLISVWGNDFTLHARSNPFMAAATRKAIGRADALHTDNQRDQRLAEAWSFPASKPSMVLPGNGGVRREIFKPAQASKGNAIQVINPRGMRAYVRNDIFFKSIPKVLEEMHGVRFACPDMATEPEALRWVKKLRIEDFVSLMPKLDLPTLADVYRSSQVMVSPSTHDGTPNSLLEAMACGCFPVAGDLDSIREWIMPGENGLLIDPNDPGALAAATLLALKNHDLRSRAAKINSDLIFERADYEQCMPRAEEFYEHLAV